MEHQDRAELTYGQSRIIFSGVNLEETRTFRYKISLQGLRWLSTKTSNSVMIKLKDICLEDDFSFILLYIPRISISVSRKLFLMWRGKIAIESWHKGGKECK